MTYVSRFSPDFSTLQKKLPLTDIQTKETKNLVLNCCLHDSIRLSYPAEPQENACHYLLYSSEGTLCAALAMVPCGETVVECTAFTLPAFRRKGCFDALLSRALEDFEEYDILFPVSGSLSGYPEYTGGSGRSAGYHRIPDGMDSSDNRQHAKSDAASVFSGKSQPVRYLS